MSVVTATDVQRICPRNRRANGMRSGIRKEKGLHMWHFASLVRVLAGVTSMRRTVVLASILLLLGTGPAAPARVGTRTATGAATFVVTGHGWGHGVGLSSTAPTVTPREARCTRRSCCTTSPARR